MKKIVITGGLGYVGTQLCKLYVDQSLNNEIIVYDSRFLPERVKQLNEWGIKYIQGSILDQDKLKNVLNNSDIIYHLAGITDVAYTKSESSTEQDSQITQVGVLGSRNIIENTPSKAKIVFPSTHVVYEGFDELTLDIKEDVKPCPILTYSKGKVQTEVELRNSNKNYIILRLGSVYGYGGDSMRMNIMPNLFAKIASMQGVIKLFAGGIQKKSLVSLFDVARCLKFVAEDKNISKETFHLSNESMTVKEVAELCKSFAPDLKLIETENKIPNKGYTISNEKLLETGFTFEHNIKQDIGDMINYWTGNQYNSRDCLEYKFSGSKEFVDARGRITNYELPESINWIGWIESKKGTVRANHYHPIQEQKCILISGKYISVYKDLKKPNSPMTTQLMEPGDVVVTQPNVAHAMVFLEDSLFLNLVNGEREHDNFGKHTIPYMLVDDRMKEELLNNYKEDCRVCGSTKLQTVLSLGNSPLANNLLKNKEQKDELYPLQLNFCPESYNVQLSHAVPREKMFDEYLYVSSTTKTFVNHFSNLVDELINRFNLNQNSFVVDIGSNDGIFLKPMKEKNVEVCGVEPAKNVAKVAVSRGVPTLNGYFEDDDIISVIKLKGYADLVTAFNVFAHSDSLKDITINAFKILKPNGQFIIEVQYILDTLKDLTFDNIYHEHVNYWSVLSLKNFFENLNLKLLNVQHVDTHGGSLRVYVGRSDQIANESVEKAIQQELDFGLDNFDTYKDFARKVEHCKTSILSKMDQIKAENKTIVGYGSPAKATTVLNYYGIDTKYIDYIVEDNDLKNGCLLPGVRIPITTNKQKLLENPPDYILVLAWNFFDYIKENNQELINLGCKFVTFKDLME